MAGPALACHLQIIGNHGDGFQVTCIPSVENYYEYCKKSDFIQYKL